MEHREESDRLEREADRMQHEADRMEHESERVGEHIEEARRDWDAKQSDASIPGAQPDPDAEERGPEMETEREESDQLPEEGPPGQSPDDAGGASREEAERQPGVPGEEERGTGQEQDAEDHGRQ